MTLIGHEIWYRLEDKRYANYDPWAEYDQPSGSHTQIEVLEFVVIKHTLKGVWLARKWSSDHVSSDKRFVLSSANKRFACPSIDEALKSFSARKRKQASIYHTRAAIAEEAIVLAERIVNRNSFPTVNT